MPWSGGKAMEILLGEFLRDKWELEGQMQSLRGGMIVLEIVSLRPKTSRGEFLKDVLFQCHILTYHLIDIVWEGNVLLHSGIFMHIQNVHLTSPCPIPFSLLKGTLQRRHGR